MITSIFIDNFKSFVNFQIALKPITVFVGNNGCGKSSFLQALDFLSCIIRNDFSFFLEQRQLKVENIKSKQLSSKRDITFSVQFSFPKINKKLLWKIVIGTNATKNAMFLVSESIENISTEQKILEYKLGETSYISDEKGSKKVLEGLNSLTFTSSVLRMINFPNDSAFSEFNQIKDFLLNSDAFDLLDTDSMRQGSRSVSQTIGNKGKQIASFIKSLSAEQKEKFNKKINSIYPSIQKIDTKTVKLAGWTSLIAEEKFKNNIKLSSYDLSDGTLRIIAFLALTEMKKSSGFVLLDEIENGINVSNAKQIIAYLTDYAEKNNRQLIVTTHSTVFLDYLDAESIAYMYKNEQTGDSKCSYIFENEEFKDKLQYLYPGEILLNESPSDIISHILAGA